MPQELVSCPVCHIPNFTPRGLKSHRCKGGDARNQKPETREETPCEIIVAGGTSLAAPGLDSSVSIPEINALHRSATYLSEKARDLGKQATMKAVLLGLKLAALKEQTPHGQWESLFASGMKRVGKPNANHDSHLLDFDSRTAAKYIAVAANITSQRLSSEQSAALMQLAERPLDDELPLGELQFLEDVTPEKSLRQLYLSMGIVKPTVKEARAMQAAEDAANQVPDPPAPRRQMTMAESLQAKKDDARRHWFGTTEAGMVRPNSLVQLMMEEARNAAESQLNHLHKADLAEIETTLRDLLKLLKKLISEA